MKITTIVGTLVAALGLAACGSTAAPTVSPTLALDGRSAAHRNTDPHAVTSRKAPRRARVLRRSQPRDRAGRAMRLRIWIYDPLRCRRHRSRRERHRHVHCRRRTDGTRPACHGDHDGNAIPVTSNPFTYGPLTAGVHTFNLSINGLLTVPECQVVTVVATCSATTGPTASVRFSGVTPGDNLDVMDSTDLLISSDPYVVHDVGVSYDDTYVETSRGSTVASGHSVSRPASRRRVALPADRGAARRTRTTI